MNELIQLRFSDTDGSVRDINAAELAEVLQGLVEFTSELAKSGAFGDGAPPEVRIRPAKEGSFIVEAILQWINDNPEGSVSLALGTGGAVVQGLNVAARRLRGEPTDFEYLENGYVKLKWPGDKVDEVPREVWDALKKMKKRTRGAMRKIMAPLSDDVEILEVREGSTNVATQELAATDADLVLDRTDYREAAHEVDEIEETTSTFSIEAKLSSIDFRPGEKWRVETNQGSRLVTIEDTNFLLEIDRGMAIHKDDIFDVTVRENRTVKNGSTTKVWTVLTVDRTRRGGDDGHNDSSAVSPATPPR